MPMAIMQRNVDIVDIVDIVDNVSVRNIGVEPERFLTCLTCAITIP